jgi:hypothetical protein
MSSILKTIKDYTEAVINGLQNGDKIIEGLIIGAKVKNGTGEITPEELAEILRRKEICEGCQFNSKNAEAKGTYSSTLAYTHCCLCKCRIGYDDSKEYCLSCNCGAEAFNEANPHLRPIEVKWRAVREQTNNE